MTTSQISTSGPIFGRPKFATFVVHSDTQLSGRAKLRFAFNGERRETSRSIGQWYIPPSMRLHVGAMVLYDNKDQGCTHVGVLRNSSNDEDSSSEWLVAEMWPLDEGVAIDTYSSAKLDEKTPFLRYKGDVVVGKHKFTGEVSYVKYAKDIRRRLAASVPEEFFQIFWDEEERAQFHADCEAQARHEKLVGEILRSL